MAIENRDYTQGNHMTYSPVQEKKSASHTPRPFVDLLISILIPSVILMKFSGEDNLGASGALIIALAFPLVWGSFEFLKYKKFNFIALLGLVSTLLTGGIGLLELNTQWLAIKEAAIPGLIGIAVLLSTYSRYPLIRTLLYNPAVIDIEKITLKLVENNNTEIFEARLLKATYLLGGTFFFSSGMNYILAKWIVVSPSGSAAFNEELGQLTLLSYPMIAIPSMLMMMMIFYYLWRTISSLTGLTLDDVLASNKINKGEKHD